MSNCILRGLTPADVEEVADFYIDIRKDIVPIVHSHGEVVEWMRSVFIPRGSSRVLQADSLLCGWMDLHEGWIDQLYCRRGFTGNGLGKTLLQDAKERSPEGLSLYTFQVNKGARRFYRREGFEEVKWGDGSGNEEGQPDLLLEWRP